MKIKVIALVLCSFTCGVWSLKAQISQGGNPISFSLPALLQEVDTQTIPPPNFAKINAEDWERSAKDDPYRIAVVLSSQFSLHNSGTWETLRNGDRIWRLAINSPGAKGLGVYYENFYLPPGARLFLYNENHKHVIGAFTGINNPPSKKFVTEKVQGEVVILEYYEPNSVYGQGIIDIGQIGYFYRNVDYLKKYRSGNPSDGFNESQNCEVNANCSEGDSWRDQQRSVVKIETTSFGGIHVCTGTMLNNTSQDCTPYFLTADHCASSAQNFQQWLFFFNFEAATCADPATQPTAGCIAGATLKARSGNGGNDIGGDFLLLELNNEVPQSFNAYFAGWDRTENASSNGVSIHHPAGDIKKISTYSSPLTTTTFDNTTDPNAHWEVTWIATSNGHGVTEGGSSGSPIFNSAGRVVGDLTGGTSFCSTPSSPDEYGKFSHNWDQNGGTSNLQLKPWLDPTNSGVTVLDGTNVPCGSPVQLDAGIVGVDYPFGTICDSILQPIITLANFGTVSLTSVIISYNVDSTGNLIFNWTGNLGANTAVDVQLPAILVTGGSHTFTVSTSQPNGNQDENNSNDSNIATFDASSAGSESVTLTITPDNFGSDITWELRDTSNAVLFSGGPYTDFNPTTISQTLCLNPGCYTFTISDAIGDGICCGQGNGNYNIIGLNDGLLVASNGQYGAGETQPFCVNFAPTCTDGIQNGAETGIDCGGPICPVCVIVGCTDTTACNYDENANQDDGSCLLPDGCTDSTACNFSLNALCDDGSCTYPGCTDTIAENYEPNAGCDDGSCIFPLPDVDIRLCSNGNNLEVYLEPINNLPYDGLLSNLVFAIKWEVAGGVSLGDVDQNDAINVFLPTFFYCPVTKQGSEIVDGEFRYQVFGATPTMPLSSVPAPWGPVTWNQGDPPVLLMRIPAASGVDFEIADDLWTINNNSNYYAELNGSNQTGVVLGSCPSEVFANITICLEGPYDPSSGLMRDDIRVAGLLPLMDPYSGTAIMDAGVLNISGDDAIVDWIQVELRDQSDSTSAVDTLTGLLQRDGDIVGLDGVSGLNLNELNGEDYFIVIRHRNHLPVMTMEPVSLTSPIDFTNGSTLAFGVDQLKNINGKLTMWAGDVNSDGVIKYSGGGNDRSLILISIGGSVITTTITGYFSEDVNMDTQVKYSGASNDRSIILINIGGSVITATKASEVP